MTTRIDYQEGQILNAEDLTDEQVYRIATRRRHNIAHHGWGIVNSLELRIEEKMEPGSKQVLVVEPGIAVDGYGRELILASRYSLEIDSPKQNAEAYESSVRETRQPKSPQSGQPLNARSGNPEAIDFWLVYEQHFASPPGGERDCATHDFSRIEERATVRITTKPDIDPRKPADPRKPPYVPEEDHPFPPQREPPNDPESLLPVYLGRVCYTAGEWSKTAQPVRPYATLVGSTVDGISQHVRMQLTDEARDQARFSIQMREADSTNGDARTQSDEQPRLTDRLVIAREGDISIMSPTRVGGLLELGSSDSVPENAPTLRSPLENAPRKPAKSIRDAYLAFDRGAETLPLARPWHFYRARVVPEEQPEYEELRLELPAGTDTVDPDRQAFVLGHFDTVEAKPPAPSKREFVPHLAVLASDAVIVNSVTVSGQLVTGAIAADPTDSRFRLALVENWARGQLAGSSVLRVNSLDVIVDLTNDSGTIKSTIRIRNPGNEHVRITTLIAAYSLKDDEKSIQFYFNDPSILSPITIAPRGQTEPITTWPKAPGSSDSPIKLVVSAVGNVVSAVGKSASDSVVFGRSSVELKSGTP